METDKFTCLRDSYIETQGDEKEVAQYIIDVLDGKIKMVITTKSSKSSPKAPVKLTNKES